jgi:ADP-ribosylglycohydrolase
MALRSDWQQRVTVRSWAPGPIGLGPECRGRTRADPDSLSQSPTGAWSATHAGVDGGVADPRRTMARSRWWCPKGVGVGLGAFDDRVRGCLIGAAIGAELGFARVAEPERFGADTPDGIFDIPLDRSSMDPGQPHRMDVASALPLIDLGVRAYLAKQGRATPEDFGQLLRGDAGIATPAFSWDNVHTTQELLKEGMHPRISGLGTAPCGLIAASMPAVGVYHFADPEYAYLDGVELASVTQPRLGADWAALCAAAIACALDPSATAEEVAATTLSIAHANNRDLFYAINHRCREAQWRTGEDAFLSWWFAVGGGGDSRHESNWVAPNPIAFVLPVLRRYGDDARKLMATLAVPRSPWALCTIAPVIGGAILGALHGPAIFPRGWLDWAEPIAANWYPLVDVVHRRAQAESQIIDAIDRLAATQGDSDSPLVDRIYGCILAGAIGNAMGSPVEGHFYTEIDAKYPGGVTGILDPACLESEDDNQMAMLLTETYLEREGLPVLARHFGETWARRLNRDHFFPLCMGNAYDLIRGGWDPRITGHWSVVTGSTVMCMEPVGMYHLCDPEYASIDAGAISYMYQRGLDVTAAQILAAAVAEALSPDADVDSVCRAALAAAPDDPMLTFDKREFKSPRDYIAICLAIAERYDDVMAVRSELYEKCLLYHHIDPLELLGLSLAIFKVADGDVRQSAIGGTNIGRDSDTIAGRAAMLSGALRGAATVPAEWIALFKREVLAKIRRNACRQAESIAGPLRARLERRRTCLGGGKG